MHQHCLLQNTFPLDQILYKYNWQGEHLIHVVISALGSYKIERMKPHYKVQVFTTQRRLHCFTEVNPFSKQALFFFLHVCSTSRLKTLCEREKLLVISNFSFTLSVFYPFGELFAISINLKLLSAYSFSLEESKLCCLGKD